MLKIRRFFLDVLHKYAEKSEKEVVGLIIGSGPLHQKLVSKASEMNIPVKFISNTAEINKYYSAFDAFILPSIFEGLGNVVVEAQMAGLNVLMSEAVPNEAVINNELVYVESLDSSIDSWVNRVEDLVLKNANRNKKSAESLRGDGHQYDLKFVNEQLENIYSF
ncbi:glycosyltransferase [Weissella cibaria]|uniref:glycosyltransferase n=1 Tax=Weissella cibaria TaxID=137591 RepID=UPI001FF6F783|nr:glycosyltransferase [Weissella cibaria]UOX37093.1 glycosyltransferase [Weissella cibaria]